MDERLLIRRAVEGDQVAFRTLYDQNVDRVFRLTFRMTGCQETAQECTQAAFIKAFRQLASFRGDSKLSTWLHSIASHEALNARRTKKRTREVHLEGDLAWQAPAVADPGLRTRIRTAVEALPEHFRTVFLMHDLEGYKHSEIAAALDVAVGTSKARLSRARAALRTALGDEIKEYVT